MKNPPALNALVALNRSDEATVYSVLETDRHQCLIRDTTPAPQGLVRASRWVDCSLVELLTPEQVGRFNGDKKFTVVLIHDDGESFIAHVMGPDVDAAIHTATWEAGCSRTDGIDPDDAQYEADCFEVVAVFAGHLEDLKP